MEPIYPVQVRTILQNNFDNQASAVQHIGTGWWSHAYAFTVDQQSFILRVSAFEEDFQKDAFAFKHFSSPTLPIPKVIQIGRFDDSHYFAITERCEGKIIAAMDEADIYPIIPELFDIAGEIHSINVSPFGGWGLTDVHGNYGFDNVVSDGARITGVLDWADDLLGDFIYDTAYLDFWSVEDIPYGALWQNYAASRGEKIPQFEERMRCYMLYLGLRTLPAAAI